MTKSQLDIDTNDIIKTAIVEAIPLVLAAPGSQHEVHRIPVRFTFSLMGLPGVSSADPFACVGISIGGGRHASKSHRPAGWHSGSPGPGCGLYPIGEPYGNRALGACQARGHDSPGH